MLMPDFTGKTLLEIEVKQGEKNVVDITLPIASGEVQSMENLDSQ